MYDAFLPLASPVDELPDDHYVQPQLNSQHQELALIARMCSLNISKLIHNMLILRTEYVCM